jgi:hypothetical protein
MSPRILHLIFLVLVLAAVPVWADEEETTDEATLRARILAEERDRPLRAMGFGRVRFSEPQRLSIGLGAIFARQPRGYHCHAVCAFKGWFVQAEPGYSGGQLSVGLGKLMAETGAEGRLLPQVHLAYGVRAALLRSWNGADLHPSDQTLAGIEGDFTVIGINFSLGAFRHVGSGDGDDGWVWSGGVGWGF